MNSYVPELGEALQCESFKSSINKVHAGGGEEGGGRKGRGI